MPVLELSIADLHSAWERVHENAGCAGVDGVTVEGYEKQAATGLPELLQQAQRGEYRALPLRKLIIEKHPPGSGKQRVLLVPAVRDRILQTATARRLSRSWEEEFLEASYAYRRGRGVDRAVARILQLRDRGFVHVLDADIEAYFDSVSHSLLLKLLAADEACAPFEGLLRNWVKAEQWDGQNVERIKRGIPQGSPISPLLANFFLTPLDRALEESGCHLIRYADDMLALASTRAEAEKALEIATKELVKLGLRLNQTKTRVVSFEEGFRFLGVEFGSGRAMIPWKDSQAGRLFFIAHPMPHKLLKEYHKPATPVPEKALPKAAVKPAVETKEWTVPNLYVTQPGAIVRKSGDRFLVEVDQVIALDIPYHRLEQILLFGPVQLTSQAMAEALDKGIKISIFSRGGRFRGSLVPAGGMHVKLRLQQYKLYDDAAYSVKVARAQIGGKIANSLAVLERFEDRDRSSDLTAEARRRMAENLAGLEVETLDAVNGHEGAAAREYFTALMQFNRSEFRWAGRVKHPATDPLNSLLSLTYTLVMNELSAQLAAAGFDVQLGFLHEVDGDRPSLALDLMEPFRAPVADRFVMTEVNRGVFQAEDFQARDDHHGVVLTPVALRKFFEAYERWMLAGVGKQGEAKVTFRDCLQEEVRRFARFMMEGGEWQPFRYPLETGDAAEASSEG